MSYVVCTCACAICMYVITATKRSINWVYLDYNDVMCLYVINATKRLLKCCIYDDTMSILRIPYLSTKKEIARTRLSNRYCRTGTKK